MPAASSRKAPVKPTRVRVRMYQVGFGDCFLLSFEYDRRLPDGRDERHVLIDFGSTSPPKSRTSLTSIAERIREHTGGQLDVVVVTHRHKDHLSAFGSQQVIERLMVDGYPKLVVRSWTEDPDVAAGATGGPAVARRGSGSAVASQSLGLVAALQSAHGFAEQLAGMLATARRRSLSAELGHLADDQLANRDAIEQLNQWSNGGRGEYLHYGMPTRIEELLPGVTVRVLGPPTVDQHPAVAVQRERDPAEFWMIYQGLLKGLGADELLQPAPATETTAAEDAAALDIEPGEAVEAARDPAEQEAPMPSKPIGPVGPVRWLTNKMQRQQLNSLLRIVRILDTVLNNTSLILLFEVPAKGRQTKRLLFGGDAQIENWEYALKFASDKDSNLDRLRMVDMYKVGHHGSRNATPRTLFNLWTEPGTTEREMFAVMSTKAGVHGKSPATAVPRQTLVAALDTRMKLFSTQDLTSKMVYVELMADLKTGTGFAEVNGSS
jgi:hypothetical protein